MATPVLIILGRIFLGTFLSAVLSVVGIGIAWGMFVFFGAVSHTTLLLLFMSGAGIGAAVGGFGAWLRIDAIPSPLGMLGLMLVVVIGGIGGAWGGFQYGAAQEVECCVGPAITPITYTALGATLGANIASIAIGLLQKFSVHVSRARVHPGPGGSGSDASSEAKPVSH